MDGLNRHATGLCDVLLNKLCIRARTPDALPNLFFPRPPRHLFAQRL
jgi:hypothetical protein